MADRATSEVHIFSSIPSYREGIGAPRHETIGRLQVNRMWVFQGEKSNVAKRIANIALYCFGLLITIFRIRPDVVVASTYPPVVAGWTASFAAKLTGSKFIYHVQDIHPEISALSGGILGKGVLRHFLRWMDNQTLRRASAIVVLSSDMRDTLAARGLESLPISIINNLPLSGQRELSAPSFRKAKESERLQAIFAGNLGRFQNLGLLVEGVSLSLKKHPNLELIILGDGVFGAELKQKWADHPQIRFMPFLPFDEAADIIREADFGLVSLSPALYRVAYPSKIITYLDLGLPLLLLAEPESGLSREIARSGLGEIPSSSSPQAISDALDALLSNPDRSKALQSWRAGEGSRDAVIAKWLDLLSRV